jgi:hypothetical protein
MSVIQKDTSLFLKVWLITLVIGLGFGATGIFISDSSGERGELGENWNFKSTSISPEIPTADDIVTFTLELKDDSNIEEIQIYLCESGVCTMPQTVTKTGDNQYTYKHSGKFPSGTVVSYRFELTYDNKTESEKIPSSLLTSTVGDVLGSLYFEFHIGENWNYKSTSIEPSQPTDTDQITFQLTLEDGRDVEDVMIEIAKLKPAYTPELPVKMERKDDNSFTFLYTAGFEGTQEVGYRFHIMYKDQTKAETIPLSASTDKVVKKDGILYFGFSVSSTVPSNGENGNGKDDDGGFLPGFESVFVVIGFSAVIIIHVLKSSKKSFR